MNPVTGGRSTLLGVRFKKEVKLRTGKCVLYGIASLFFVRSKGIEYIPFFYKKYLYNLPLPSAPRFCSVVRIYRPFDQRPADAV